MFRCRIEMWLCYLRNEWGKDYGYYDHTHVRMSCHKSSRNDYMYEIENKREYTIISWFGARTNITQVLRYFWRITTSRLSLKWYGTFATASETYNLCHTETFCSHTQTKQKVSIYHVNDNTIYQMNGNTYSYKNGNLVFGILRPSIRFLWRISIFSDNRILPKAKLVPGRTVISTSQNLCYWIKL
jgi:hypothetical protein